MISSGATLLDEFLPAFDVATRHEIDVRAPGDAAYRAVRGADLGASPTIRLLFLLRGLPVRLRGSRGHRAAPSALTLDGLVGRGFTLLGARPPHEIALGLAGRFWTPTGSLERLDAAAFRAFDRPGSAKAVWSFRLLPADDGTTRIITDTRVRCLDPASRRRFRIYWRIVGPFSGLVRRAALRAIKREAER